MLGAEFDRPMILELKGCEPEPARSLSLLFSESARVKALHFSAMPAQVSAFLVLESSALLSECEGLRNNARLAEWFEMRYFHL